MLRPERMSKVSVTGSRRVLGDVIETVHDLHLLDLSDYDGEIEGFDTGSPLAGAEEAADKLVTVRSLESILDVTEADAGPTRILEPEAFEERLSEIRETVNEHEDERSAIESELGSVEDDISEAQPFVDLGIDLDLLRGYETLDVAVGEGDPAAVEAALSDTDGVEAYEVFADEDVLAAFAYPNDGDSPIDDAIVGLEFNRFSVPEASGDPEEYVAELEHRRQKLENRLESVESDIRQLRLEYAGFLLAAEEQLSIEVQKKEVPLNLATTEHAFVAEGWIPAETYDEFEETVLAAADGHVDVDEMAVADYREYVDGHDETHGGNGDGDGDGDSEADDSLTGPAGSETGETADAVADGGHVELEADDSPPVVQDNPGVSRPFELLVQVINRPNYWEIDPTWALLLTFPIFFGFMIGDVGYGILYGLLGYLLMTRTESDGLRSLGGIALWAAGFTVLFGVLYGEFFGLHGLGDILWGGHPPMHKGLQPGYINFAQAWLFLTLFVGLGHLTLGYILGFVNLLPHGLKDATLEKGSWVFLMGGVWLWIFSRHAGTEKPDLLFSVFNRAGADLPAGGTVAADQVAYSLGFGGFPATVGIAGLALGAVGLTMLLLGEGGIGLLESLNVLVNVLSYTRIAAVLLAKAGMAFVVNLLFFGGYEAEGAFHFYSIGATHGAEHGTELFSGLVHMGPLGWLGGVAVFVLGHLLVLALGITSAGLQAVRLEYVEFFGKFYEGGGDKYEPFGHQRQYTTED